MTASTPSTRLVALGCCWLLTLPAWALAADATDPAAVEPGRRLEELLPRLAVAEPEQRLDAVRQLAELRDEGALTDLARTAATDAHPMVRLHALHAVGAYDDPAPALAELRRILAAEAPEPRWHAAFALATLGEADGLPLLHDGLRSPDLIQRRQAVMALARVHDDESARRLAPLLLSPSTSERSETVLALGNIGDATSFILLLGALGDTEPEVRWHVCMVLGKQRNVRAILPLHRLLTEERDPKVIDHARTALVKLEALL